MKKLFVVIAAVSFLASCGGTQKDKSASDIEEKASVSEFSEIAKGISNEHNAKNSLDYQGTYLGKVPTASGEGMIISISISDSTYAKETEYVAKPGSRTEDTGKYTWNAEGNIITLEGIKDAPNKYFVGENTLTQLDMEGNKITGDMAKLYVLTK